MTNLRSLLIDARQFVGKSRCSVGHSVNEVIDRAKAGPRYCLYCKDQADLHERLAQAISDITTAEPSASHPHAGEVPHVVATLCPTCYQDLPPDHPDRVTRTGERTAEPVLWARRVDVENLRAGTFYAHFASVGKCGGPENEFCVPLFAGPRAMPMGAAGDFVAQSIREKLERDALRTTTSQS